MMRKPSRGSPPAAVRFDERFGHLGSSPGGMQSFLGEDDRPRHDLRDDLGEQLFFGAEVAVDEHRRDARLFRDFPDSGPVVAGARKRVPR